MWCWKKLQIYPLEPAECTSGRILIIQILVSHFYLLSWVKGYGFEAAMAVLKEAKERLGVSKILVFTVPHNNASVKCLEKLGLKILGITFLKELESRFFYLKYFYRFRSSRSCSSIFELKILVLLSKILPFLSMISALLLE
jgi:hypothetical protein